MRPHSIRPERRSGHRLAGLGCFVLLVLVGQIGLQNESLFAGEAFDDEGMRQRILQLYPQHLPDIDHPWFNRPSAAKVALGRSLFTDPYLSRCGTVSCASCHQPEHGWASPHRVPPGCDGVRGRRRAPTLYNVAYQSHFFWDGRVQSLEQQALLPIASPAELGNSWDAVLTYLRTGRHEPTQTVFPKRRVHYAQQFATVFQGEITPVTVARALAAYERSLIARQAPFDRWLAGYDAALDPLQKRGLALFFGRANCSVCHPPPGFTDHAFHNIAVPQAGFETADLFPHNATIRAALESQGWTIPASVDLGRQEAPSLQSASHALGAFKTPTLRNVTLHHPYMHNGVFTTLKEVMHHYEMLAAGERQPLVGKLAFYVRYRKAFLGKQGGGAAGDNAAMIAFMHALEGNQSE